MRHRDLAQGDGDVYPDLGVNISNLPRMLADKGDISEAEALHQEACSIILKAHGEDHWMSASCRSLYGTFLTRLARYEQAEALLLGSYPLLRDTLGLEHDRRETTIAHLVELYEAWEKPDRAEYRALLPVPETAAR